MEIMIEQLISFETAKLAKEKKFNIPQLNRYLIDQFKKPSLAFNKSLQKIGIQAPTQALLQKWLREKHNIHIHVTLEKEEVDINDASHGSYMYTIRVRNENPQKRPYEFSNWCVWETYEEALEQGLIEALNLIK